MIPLFVDEVVSYLRRINYSISWNGAASPHNIMIVPAIPNYGENSKPDESSLIWLHVVFKYLSYEPMQSP